MFSFFRTAKKEEPPKRRTATRITNEEREIATKYGLTFENYIAMRKEVCKLKVRWGRPVGAKNKKKKTNVVK